MAYPYVFDICGKCGCVYQATEGSEAQANATPTCAGGGVHKSAGSYQLIVELADLVKTGMPSSDKEATPDASAFGICGDCGVLCIQQKYAQYCLVNSGNHKLKLPILQLFHGSIENHFRVCGVCSCLYSPDMKTQSCAGMTDLASPFELHPVVGIQVPGFETPHSVPHRTSPPIANSKDHQPADDIGYVLKRVAG
jgi:hypothetical protein